MNSRHTPAPWITKEQGDANQYWLMTKDGGWIMSVVHNGEKSTFEQLANMLLISSAPIMLEAIQSFVDDFETDYVLDDGQIVDNPTEIFVAHYKLFKAVIKLVTRDE